MNMYWISDISKQKGYNDGMLSEKYFIYVMLNFIALALIMCTEHYA